MGPDLDIPAHEKGPEWTSDTRDEKLRTLLQGKQDDAENARILIDLLENGFLGADSSGDSDSEDGSDLDALTMSRADSADIPLPDDVDFDVGSDMPRPDPAAVPLPSSPRYFEDDVEYGVTVAAGLQSSGFDPDIVIEEPTTLSPGIHGLPVGVARRDNRQAESATRIANGVSVAQAVDGVDASDSDSDQSGWGAHGNKARGKKITSPRSGGEAEELVAWFGEDQADGRLQVSSTKGWESLSTRFQLEAETLDGASGEQNERKERVLERGLRGESDEGADLDLVPRVSSKKAKKKKKANKGKKMAIYPMESEIPPRPATAAVRPTAPEKPPPRQSVGTATASLGGTPEGQASQLEDNESEVRELERQLKVKKARLEEMRRERERARCGGGPVHHHNTTSVMKNEPEAGPAVHHTPPRVGCFSWVKSRFRRLFFGSGAESDKTPRPSPSATRDRPNSPSHSKKPSQDGGPAGRREIGAETPAFNMFIINGPLPPTTGTENATPRPPPMVKKPTPPLPPPKVSDSETLLRTKIFAPHPLSLMTALPEPVWTSPPDQTTTTYLFSPAAVPLTRHTLTPQGQFVAQRERDVKEALDKIELGLGVSAPTGAGVNFTSTGVVGLLKPYKWVTMWRGMEREIYVPPSPLAGGPADAGKGSDMEGKGCVDMETLHALENELMAPGKYQFGESEYLTVFTHSSDVNSGAASLFRASFGGPDGSLVTKLTLEARFKDMPREICKILTKEVESRYELHRKGRRLTCRATGGKGVLPPCLAVVQCDGVVSADGEVVEGGWVNIGGGWRRAMRIILSEGDAGTGPREGLVATVPQMLAFLHLTHRVVDYVPSTPVFSFDPPLMGMAGDGACRVRRGTKLLGQPGGAVHVGESVTISVLFSRESRWVREQLLWA